jgi:butyrate kinase
VLTGGLCGCKPLVAEIRRRVGFLAPVFAYPDNMEMSAMAEGALRAVRGRERTLRY